MTSSYQFDRFLRYDELTAWLRDLADTHPDLVTMERYGASHEGRDLWLMTVTDSSTGEHDTKPAHWVDASIHAIELTATVAACHLLHHLVTGHRAADPAITEALRTRTFYVVPRVNPDGAERVLADRPRFLRSSTRAWPWSDGHRWPGLDVCDVDGDGRVLQMRLPDPDGAWMPHDDEPRLLVPVPPEGAPAGTPRYRLLHESTGHDLDGFTLPTPWPSTDLDLNRNFPAGWGSSIPGSGDHPLSEPEIDALVRAITARTNVCGYNAMHTYGAVLLRPSSTRPDRDLPPFDVWAWTELGRRGTELTGYPVHSVFEDFTWDPTATMSGASDDWAFEHLGIFGWTTEFWDVVHEATGAKQSTLFWYTGPTADESLAVLRWLEAHDLDGFVAWYPFDHPQLGPVELGGWNNLAVWINPPPSRLRAEVERHASFAVHQALCSPRIELRDVRVDALGPATWRVSVGVVNTGWLPTTVSAWAAKHDLVRPLTVEIEGVGVTMLGEPSRVRLGQLAGRADLRFRHAHDGTPDRVLHRFTVSAPSGATARITAEHPRGGRVSTEIVFDVPIPAPLQGRRIASSDLDEAG